MIGVSNALHLSVGCHEGEITFFCLGAHPKIVFIDTKSLSSRFVDPILDVFRSVAAKRLSKVFESKFALQLSVGFRRMMGEIENCIGARMLNHLL